MYTIKDLASNNFQFLNEFTLIDVEGVKRVTLIIVNEKRKIIIGISFYDYFLSSTFKNLIREKVKKDLGVDFSFAISF